MRLPALLLCASALAACQPPSPAPAPAAKPVDQFGGQLVTNPAARFDETKPFERVGTNPDDLLLRRLAALEFAAKTNQISTDERLRWLERLSSRVQILEDSSAQLDPTAKGFDTIRTKLGTLLVADATAEPYLDGYTVRFKIGNLTSANIGSYDLVTTWGPPLPDRITDADWDKVAKQTRTVTNSMLDTLAPGSWSTVNIKLIPATAESVRNVTVRIVPQTISLR